MAGATVDQLLAEAATLRRQGRVPEAIHAYERLLAIEPELPESWYNLGYLQRHAGRFRDALDAYQKALHFGASDPEEVHLNRAVILADHLGRSDEAEAELRAALELNPTYLPAWLNLGNLHEDQGRRDRARDAYRRALDADPDNALALARLAGVSDFAEMDDPLIDRLRAALADAARPPTDRADLGFALGRALDSLGAYQEAFATYADANCASLSSFASEPRYDAAAQERLVDRIIAAFPNPASRLPAGDAQPPIFICGMFRSGSTLAEQILASHSMVTPGGELDLLPDLIRDELQPYPEAAAGLSPERVARLRHTYLERLRSLHPDAAVTTDKRPDNFLHIGLIKTLFPDARIVHTVRDPLDNGLSIFFLHLGPEFPYGSDLAQIGHWYRQYCRLVAHWQALYPGDIFDLDYDRLVAKPEAATRALLEFCGLDWEEAVLSFHRTDRTVKTASVWQVREPLYRRSSGRCHNYRPWLQPLVDALEG